jgi:hypothetical protein
MESTIMTASVILTTVSFAFLLSLAAISVAAALD